MFKHLLVPTDGSALSEAAVQIAVTLAKESLAKITAVHVMPEFHVLAYETEMLADTEAEFVRVAQQQADRYLSVIAKASEQAGIECDVRATTGWHPYEVIIRIAAEQDCDLIVMGSHGRGGTRALLIGSETQKVLTHSQIPVLVVRRSPLASTERETDSGTSSIASENSPPPKYIVARASLDVMPGV